MTDDAYADLLLKLRTMKDGAGLLEYRGAIEAEKLQAMLADKPVRDGQFGKF
jgi:hypothetical protein